MCVYACVCVGGIVIRWMIMFQKFHPFSTPSAMPTLEVENQVITQLQPNSHNERCAEVQSDLRIGPYIRKCFPKHSGNDNFFGKPNSEFSVLFQNKIEEILESNVEMLSDV
jgi:hypothetical protein